MLGSQGEGLWVVLMNSPIQTYQVMINSGFCLVSVFKIYFKVLQFLKAKRWENSWCFSSSCQHLTTVKWLRKKTFLLRRGGSGHGNKCLTFLCHFTKEFKSFVFLLQVAAQAFERQSNLPNIIHISNS